MTSEQRQALVQLVNDEYLVDGLAAVCQDEYNAAITRLVEATQIQGTRDLSRIVQYGTSAQFYSELVDLLKRRAEGG